MRRGGHAVVGAVVALHAAALAAVLLAASPPVTPPALPVMQVSMVMEQAEVLPETVAIPVPPRLPPPVMPPPEAAISEPSPAPPPPAAAPAAKAEPVVMPPQVSLAHGAAPPVVYPALSRRLGESGTVLLHLHVLADGRIGEVKVLRSSGFPRLDRAATDAALRWQLTPARRGDEPVAMWYQWPIVFGLE